MKSTIFFAAPEELLAWVQNWQTLFGLHVGFVTFRPQRSLLAVQPPVRLDAVWKQQMSNGPDVEEVWMSLRPLNSNAANTLDLVKNNPDCFIITLPKLAGCVLTEGDIGTTTEEREHLRVWRKIIADLKQKTRPGMWVVGGTGAIRFYRDKRFSAGTEEMARRGWRLANQMGLDVRVTSPQAGIRGRS